MQRFEYPKGGRGFCHFIRGAARAVVSGEAPPITSEETLQIIKTVFAFYQAAQSGKCNPSEQYSPSPLSTGERGELFPRQERFSQAPFVVPPSGGFDVEAA